MEFFIRQGASDPILKLELIDDGKNDMSSFNDILENADIRFEMSDSVTQEPEILDGLCLVTTRTKLYHQTTTEYYITYRFTSEQTSKIGKYEGKVIVQFRDINLIPTSKLILPVREKLYINIF
jgi:hypothetical protein